MSGVDQQRHAPGATGCRASSSSTAPAPSRCSAAAPAKRGPTGHRRCQPPRQVPRTSTNSSHWQDRLRLAESKFPGFRGTELFRPVEGVQEEWTALYRYDTADDLDRWLVSDERKQLLAEGEKFADFQSAHHRQLIRQLVRLRRDTAMQAPPPSDVQDLHRGVGGPVPDGRVSDSCCCPR